MNKKEKNFTSIVGIVISMAVGAGGMYLANYRKLDFMNRYPEFVEFDKYIEETLMIDAPANPTMEDTVNAYLSLYGDKYTVYEGKTDIHSKEYVTEETNKSAIARNMKFEIGFNSDDELLFTKVEPDGKAAEQGVLAGDIIKSIDGQAITEYKVTKQIRGQNNTAAKLIIERDGKEFEMDFLRYVEEIDSLGVESEMFGDTLYIRFDDMTASSVNIIETALAENEFEKLILDLRNNGGGETTIAVRVADAFIDKADVRLKSRRGGETVQSTSDGVVYDVPIYLIVNENTASSAEILTSLLKQYADTTIIGTTTFGKGIYQGRAMYKGGNLKYTQGETYVGEWENWQGKGISPDIEIYMDSEYIGTEYDIQFEKALELAE